jgi:hypothetical protein
MSNEGDVGGSGRVTTQNEYNPMGAYSQYNKMNKSYAGICILESHWQTFVERPWQQPGDIDWQSILSVLITMVESLSCNILRWLNIANM